MITPSQCCAQLTALLSARAVDTGAYSEPDWQRLVDLAGKQRVAPLLYARLKERDIAPGSVTAERLRRSYLANLGRNTRLFHELGHVLRALEANGVPVIILKGACLAETIYDNIGLRQMGDVDLWIPRGQLDAAREVMRSLGYESRSKMHRPQALQDALTGETQMFKSGAPMVELHWNIFAGEWLRHTSQIDEQTIWQRSVPLHGEMVRQLSPEDTVIHLCVHLAVNHRMSGIGLRTLLDLDFARRKWVIDWGTVVQRARAWRVSCATWMVLHALVALFGDRDGDLRVAHLAPSRLRQVALEPFMSRRFLAESFDRAIGPRRFWLLLLLVDRPADALLLVWRAFFPDRAWLTLRYDLQGAPSWRVLLQRLWHPLLVAAKREI